VYYEVEYDDSKLSVEISKEKLHVSDIKGMLIKSWCYLSSMNKNPPFLDRPFIFLLNDIMDVKIKNMTSTGNMFFYEI